MNVVQNPGMANPLTIRSVNCNIQTLIMKINTPRLIKFNGKQTTIKIGRIVIDNKLNKNPARRTVGGLLISTRGNRNEIRYNANVFMTVFQINLTMALYLPSLPQPYGYMTFPIVHLHDFECTVLAEFIEQCDALR